MDTKYSAICSFRTNHTTLHSQKKDTKFYVDTETHDGNLFIDNFGKKLPQNEL
jgi:hypothetical protein